MPINFHKVTDLPGTPQADAVYFDLDGTNIIGYVTDTAGVARPFFNQALTDARINALMAANQAVELVADIAARDALVTSPTNLVILVADATADATVDAGAATYFLDEATDTFTKVSEFESLDVVLDWASLINGPTATVAAIDAAAAFVAGLTATPAQIDQAVTDSHTHANLASLNSIGDTVGDGTGTLTYNGAAVVATIDWTTLGF